MTNDMDQVVTIDMVHNADTLRNELVEYDPPHFISGLNLGRKYYTYHR